jgi:hypothetical protein
VKNFFIIRKNEKENGYKNSIFHLTAKNREKEIENIAKEIKELITKKMQLRIRFAWHLILSENIPRLSGIFLMFTESRLILPIDIHSAILPPLFPL